MSGRRRREGSSSGTRPGTEAGTGSAAGSGAGVDRVFHALGDSTRRAMLERMSRGPVSVSELAGPLAVTLAAVVQHLQVLERSGLVRTSKTGRVRTCRIESAGFSVAEQWIRDRRALWEQRFDLLDDLLAEPDEEIKKK